MKVKMKKVRILQILIKKLSKKKKKSPKVYKISRLQGRIDRANQAIKILQNKVSRVELKTKSFRIIN